MAGLTWLNHSLPHTRRVPLLSTTMSPPISSFTGIDLSPRVRTVVLPIIVWTDRLMVITISVLPMAGKQSPTACTWSLCFNLLVRSRSALAETFGLSTLLQGPARLPCLWELVNRSLPSHGIHRLYFRVQVSRMSSMAVSVAFTISMLTVCLLSFTLAPRS